MVSINIYREHSLRIGIGITLMALLVAGGASAMTEIDACTIISSPGAYVLNKSLINSDASTCIEITSSDVVLEGAGYTIDGVDTTGTYGIHAYYSLKNITVRNLTLTDWDIGIYLKTIQFVTIENNTLLSNSKGIWNYFPSIKDGFFINNTISNNEEGIIAESTNITFIGNNISNNGGTGIRFVIDSNDNKLIGNNISNNNGGGISIKGSENSIFSGNILNSNSYGIYLADASYNTISGNIIKYNVYSGIKLDWMGGRNKIIENIISSNSNGISIYNCISCNISDNLISNNKDIGIYSAHVVRGSNISGNNILNNGNGISFVYDHSNIIISGNNISNKGYGIHIDLCHDNIIYNNYFNNTKNIIESNPTGINYYNITKTAGTNIIGGSYLGGNYWSDYAGVDTDGDGLGDTMLPYNSSGGIINGGDYLPLVKPLLIIPAIVEIKPDTLNKASQSDKNAVIVYIEIPGYDVNLIDLSTIIFSTTKGKVIAQLSPTVVGDYDSDGMPDRMVKFNRQAVIGIVDIGNVVIRIGGKIDGEEFEGSDEIRVIN